MKDLLAKIDFSKFDPNVEIDPEIEQLLRANLMAHEDSQPQFVAFLIERVMEGRK